MQEIAMRRILPLVIFALPLAASPAQAQFLKKLEESLKKAIPAAAAAAPAAGEPTPADKNAAPRPVADPDDGELPPPAPAGKQPGYLGATGVSDAGGFRIDGLKEVGNAKKSGLEVGDRVTAINGKKVKNDKDFETLMNETVPGETISLTVDRAGKKQDVKVKLVERPPVSSEPEAAPGVVVPPGAGGPLFAPRAAATPARASLGATVITLTPELKAGLGVPVNRGAVVTMVRPGSPAERTGIPVDAVIVAMDGEMVTSSEQLVEMIRAAKPGSEVELSYYQGDKLARKSVKLAPATAISTLPPGYGGEPPLNLGTPGASRPFLSKVEKVLDTVTKPAAAVPDTTAADIVSLQQSFSNMQAQMKLLLERIDELEARVKKLETPAPPKPAAAPKPADDEAPRTKPKDKAKVPTLEGPTKTK
jgi:membrane-associated protease RseP (regulator of RpoE activity)